MELEREQLKAQLRETDDQLSKLLPRQICLRRQLGCLSQKEADAIRRELSAIEDQESLDAQEQEALPINKKPALKATEQKAGPRTNQTIRNQEAHWEVQLLTETTTKSKDTPSIPRLAA